MLAPTIPIGAKERTVQADLDTARTELSRLAAERDSYALLAFEGDASARKQHAHWAGAVAQQELAVKALEQALAGAREHDRQVRVAAQKDRIGDCLKIAEKRARERAKAAEAFTAALTEAAKQYHVIVEKTANILDIWPASYGIDTPWRDREYITEEIKKAVSSEGWRLSGVARGGVSAGLELPPAKPQSLSEQAVPSAATPLVSMLRDMDAALGKQIEKAREQLK
ncbi:MAG TPA: hypothetical protein VN723_05730 [Rhizomicrobium sp.]|nr:hypothetical protein [Rhizomicrobium sp.]